MPALEPQQIFAQINEVLKNPDVQQIGQQSLGLYSSNLGVLKAISIFATAFFIGSTVFFAIKTGWLSTRVDRVEDVVIRANMPRRRSIRAWQKIQKHFFAGDENRLKMAVIEADSILDEVLKLAGFRGENLGERLKKINESQLPNIEELWEAHKLRNKLVHESDFHLTRDIAEKALTVYEQTFRDLGLIN